MKVSLEETRWDEIECDGLVLPVFVNEDEGWLEDLDLSLGGLISELKQSEEWLPKAGEMTVVYRPEKFKARRILLLGAGKKAAYDGRSIRELLVKAVRRLKSDSLKRVAVYRRSTVDPSLAAQAVVEGVVLSTFDGDAYKTSDKARNSVERVLYVTDQKLDRGAIESAMARGAILADAANMARGLVNEPGNRIKPADLAEKAAETAARCGLEIEVLDQKEMERRGMGAVLAVARGSEAPPCFIILRHQGAPNAESPPAVLVGKGVTFDSGGLSLKPSDSMEEMKADKAGACTVLGAMQAIALMGVKKNVVGLIPAVENMPGGRALRPGDVIQAMNGKTIEVLNTDAEGRLILADALCFARQLQPEYVVDVATLTGACVVALGHLRAGLFSNHEATCDRLLEAARISGEWFWRLPLDEAYRKQIESPIADIKNVGGRWGGAITAAKFLQEFVEDMPWCHIDMAGVDLFKTEDMKGPTGFGVRTLAEMVAL